MSTTQRAPLTVDELQRLVKSVEPAAYFVPGSLMRRVIKHDRDIGGLALLVPHRKGYVIEREALLRCVQPHELGVRDAADLPPIAYLLVQPSPHRLAQSSVDYVLVKHWRVLFHLHVDRQMQGKLASGVLSPAMVRERIGRLGLTEFAEITDVLRHEEYLLPPVTPASTYAEFVAVYLTLRHFAPARLANFFPGLRDLSAVDALIAEDIDANPIYEATRLPGAPAPASLPMRISQRDGVTDEAPGPRSEPTGPPGLTSALLVPRLQSALELSDVEAERWREALTPLAPFATRGAWGSWSQEARLLADLESACDDVEHGICAVDLVGWIVSLGKLQIQRQLPAHQQVSIVRRLRQAVERTRYVRLTNSDRQRLSELLIDEVDSRERRMRVEFRPLLVDALMNAGVEPQNLPEEVGRDKLVEELLDRVVEYGHINFGNLRDAISRNPMKLPDLTGAKQLVGGDALIRLNRELSIVLDGVYRRGEFYLRWLHRLNSLAFGTAPGRLLVLFLILPFGLAFFALITPAIAVEEGEKLVGWISRLMGTAEPPPPESVSHEFPLPNRWTVVALGIFFLLLFHVPRFRKPFFAGIALTYGGTRSAIVGALHAPALRAIVSFRHWSTVRRLMVWPLLLAAAGWWLGGWNGPDPLASTAAAAGLFIIGLVVLNTPLGGPLEETLIDRSVRLWHWFNTALLPSLFQWIMDLSRLGLEAVEQVLYTVNEWLRSRSGESRATFIFKLIAGVIWFGVTYVIRFAINLLIEPQINPIKHFPVVTVSHKICLPMIPTLSSILANVGVQNPTTTATGIIFGIPGIFGFMVWELKENWKLYRANRAAHLGPVLIGSHGETMRRLLRPGFHSGTVPKLFQKLRRAELHGRQRTARKLQAALQHIEESIAHFVERELIALLRQSKSCGGLHIDLGDIQLATNRVLVELNCASLGQDSLTFSFDHQSGWLLAGVLEEGWLMRMNRDQRETVALALAGLYRLAGADLTREDLARWLPTTTRAYEVVDDQVVAWTEGTAAISCDLREGPVLANAPIAWLDWARLWGERRL